jgi:undecaprenyl-diphosphatase
MDWLESLLLGVVQGLTEFLPVSSDGHLAITQQAFARLRGSGRSGAENLFFDVMLHLGTLAAILVHYRAVAKTSLRGLFGSTEVPPAYRRNALIRVGMLALVATLPLVPDALFLKKWIDQAFQSTMAAGIGFLITAAVLLLTIRLRGGDKGPQQTSWADALLIGLAQMIAPFPGVSRSGLTIAAALGLGLSRAWAVGFSLLIAIPAIVGAAVFEIKDVDPATLTPDRIAQTVVATVLAGLIGYGAIIWLVKIVRSGRFWYFSVYLIVLGIVVLTVSANSGSRRDAGRSEALDRTARGRLEGQGAGRGPDGSLGPLDRPVTGRSRSAHPAPRPEASGGDRAAGLVLGRPLAGDR